MNTEKQNEVSEEEIEAELKKYIEQFWHSYENGGAIIVGFKRGVKWMQERCNKNSATSIKDKELLTPDQMLKKFDVEIDRWPDTQTLIHEAMEAYAKQYAQSQQNNSEANISNCIEPWKSNTLNSWSIIGMNHYHIDGKKYLFVSISKGNTCVTYEGLDDGSIWESLEQKISEL